MYSQVIKAVPASRPNVEKSEAQDTDLAARTIRGRARGAMDDGGCLRMNVGCGIWNRCLPWPLKVFLMGTVEVVLRSANTRLVE